MQNKVALIFVLLLISCTDENIPDENMDTMSVVDNNPKSVKKTRKPYIMELRPIEENSKKIKNDSDSELENIHARLKILKENDYKDFSIDDAKNLLSSEMSLKELANIGLEKCRDYEAIQFYYDNIFEMAKQADDALSAGDIGNSWARANMYHGKFEEAKNISNRTLDEFKLKDVTGALSLIANIDLIVGDMAAAKESVTRYYEHANDPENIAKGIGMRSIATQSYIDYLILSDQIPEAIKEVRFLKKEAPETIKGNARAINLLAGEESFKFKYDWPRIKN